MTLFLLGAMLPAFLQEAVDSAPAGCDAASVPSGGRGTTDHDKRSRERDDEVAQSGKFVVCVCVQVSCNGSSAMHEA